MHGAGTIVAIEEKRILGENKRYYVLQIPVGNIKVMIPMSNFREVGLRDIIGESEANFVIETFRDCREDTNSNWNRRYRENIDRLRSGVLADVAYVVKTLMLRERVKNLSNSERKMLTSAKNILISELTLAKNAGSDEIDAMLTGFVDVYYEESAASTVVISEVV